MIKRVILDSSPLITLIKGGLVDILPRLFEQILVPEAVIAEILSGRENDEARSKINELKWIDRVSGTAPHADVVACRLGRGETEAISLAATIPDAQLVIDDFAARRCAGSLHLRFVGTGGLLIIAKRRGLILSVGEALENLKDAGLWLSDDVLELLKTKAGE